MTMDIAQSLIAVRDEMPTAGAIAWWRLSGVVDAGKLEEAWRRYGLPADWLPTGVTPAVALHRAVSGWRAKHRLVRPLGRGNGYALVDEKTQGTGEEDDTDPLAYHVDCTIKLDAVGRVKVVARKGAKPEALEAIRQQVAGAYSQALDELSTEDISTWLVGVMESLSAVSLRDTGGVYFVPHASMAPFVDVVRALTDVSNHKLQRVPALRSDEAVDAILDAVSMEAVREADAMESEIAENAARQLGSQALENRVDHCDKVEQKLSLYEELLGTKLDQMHERIKQLRTQLSVALLKAQAEEEEE